MIVKFVRYLGTEEPLAYFEKKWRLVHGIGAVQAYELSLDSLTTATNGAKPPPLEGKAALPKHEDQHREVAVRIAEAAMPLLEGESLAEPDALDVLAADALGMRKGT